MVNNELMHFGVKGMHWGIRKSPEEIRKSRERKSINGDLGSSARKDARIGKVANGAKGALKKNASCASKYRTCKFCYDRHWSNSLYEKPQH